MSVSYQPADATEGWFYQFSKIEGHQNEIHIEIVYSESVVES